MSDREAKILYLRKLPFEVQRTMYRQFYGLYVLAELRNDSARMDEVQRDLSELQDIFRFTEWTLRQVDADSRASIAFIEKNFFRTPYRR